MQGVPVKLYTTLHTVPPRLVPQPKNPPLEEGNGGGYSLFLIQDSRAFIGNSSVFHVIDLDIGQEVDRIHNDCGAPQWLYALLSASCDSTNDRLSTYLMPVFPQSEPHVFSYPANNLRIDLTGQSAGPLVTLDTNINVPLPIKTLTFFQIGGLGRILIVQVRLTYENSPPNLRLFAVFACRILGETTANVRSDASVESESLGKLKDLYEGENVGVIAQKQQSDGVWWQLAPGGWVRDDVTKKEGDCTGVPLMDE